MPHHIRWFHYSGNVRLSTIARREEPLHGIGFEVFFESRGGKAVVSVVRLALAIGLSISEQTLGFSLRSCAPLAAGTFIFFVGFTLYLGIRAAGMSAVNAGSVALVMTYVSIAAVAPGFVDWITGNPYTAWIQSVVVIALVMVVHRLIRMLLLGKSKNLGQVANQLLRGASQGEQELADQLKQVKRARAKA